MRRRWFFCGGCLWVAGFISLVAAETEQESSGKQASLEALKEFNVLIGQWRGIGMPKRYSRQGAWQEQADWVWELGKDSAVIRYDVEDGQLVTSGRLAYDGASRTYSLDATLPDKSKRQYRGKLDGKTLALESAPDEDDTVYRVTLNRLNDDRVTVLFEKRSVKQSFYTRIAEIGYQRAGTKLAATGASGPECIVTGGKGTIKVEYKGQTYYVCCTGCRDAFNDDPEGILAEAGRKKAEKANSKER